MRRKILTLLLIGLCMSFVILSNVGIYIRSVMRENLFRLGEDFGEKTSEYVWEQSREQTMNAVKQLTVARAAQIDSEMEELKEDAELLSNMMTRIISNPNKYLPHDFNELSSREITANVPFILFSEEIFYSRSPALNEEIAIAANIEDLLIDLHLSYVPNNNSCYIASENGYFICVDTIVEDENISEPYDARQRPWYKAAQQANKITFSNIYVDESGNKSITCAAPYYDGKDFAGVVGIGCDITTWYDLLFKIVVSEGRDCFILNEEGKVILSSEDNSFLAVTVEDNDLTESPDEQIASLAKKMTAGMTGVEEIYLNGEECYISFTPMETIGWSMGLLTPDAEVVEVADDTKDYFLEQFNILHYEIEDEYSRLSIIGAIFLLITLALLVIASNLLTKKFLKPINELTAGVKEISAGNLEKKLDIKTNDELQTLAENFNVMTDELKTQIANLTKVTAERERIATELDVATRIQMSMLPKNFSVDKRVELFATMTPAKEVGGDLYDFYKLDENHLFITIADVSGKGVPAALFMVAAITNLRNYTSTLKNPDDLKIAIENTNNRLCANNDVGLFVTAFSGVLDLTTGIFRYVNAGHNPPLIRRHGKNFEELPMELNFVLGGWEDWQYVQQEIQLEAGDMIFLYTDGVTEAADASGKMYSLERLQKFLTEREKNSSAKKILVDIHESLQNFSGDAEQSDDITMLAVKFERSN